MTLQSREYLFHVTVASHKKDPVEISGEYPKNRKNKEKDLVFYEKTNI